MATSKETVNGVTYYYKNIEIGYDSDGKRKRKKIRAKTVRELNEKLEKYKSTESDNNVIFRDFLKKWLYEVHFMHLKSSTKEKYDGLYNKYLKDSDLCMIKLSNINAIVVQKYYNNLSSKGVSDSLVSNIHKIIRPCLTYAYANGFTTRDFGATGLIKLPKNKERSINNMDVFSLEDQKAFTEYLANNDVEDKYLFLLALSTGMRLGEILGLQWNDIDFSNKTLSIKRSIRRVKDLSTNKNIIEITEPKTKNSIRSIPLGDKICSYLKQVRKKQLEYKLQLANLYEDNDLVFCTNTGKYLDASNVRKRYKKALRKANIRELKFHALRHTFATRLFENNVPPKTVSAILGHSDINITLDIYTHVLDKTKIEAINILNDII